MPTYTTPVQTAKSAARLNHEQRLTHRLIFEQLATDAPAGRTKSSTEPFVSSPNILTLLRKELGLRGSLTKDQFDLLVQYARRDLKDTLNDYGYICQKAIHCNPYASLLEKILHIILQDVGIKHVKDKLELHTKKIGNKETDHQQDDFAYSIITDIISETSSQKGYQQSITQLTISRGFGIGQVFVSIEKKIDCKLDAYRKAILAGTEFSQHNRVAAIEDYVRIDQHGDEEVVTGYCPLSSDTPDAVINAISHATTEKALARAISTMSEDCKKVLRAWVTDNGQHFLTNNGPGPSAEFTALVVRLRPVTGLSVRRSRAVAQKIVDHFRQAFDMAQPERRSTKGWVQRDLKTVLKRKVQNAVSPVIDQPFDWHHQGSFTPIPEPCTSYPKVITVPIQVHSKVFNQMICDLFNRTRNGTFSLARVLNAVD